MKHRMLHIANGHLWEKTEFEEDNKAFSFSQCVGHVMCGAEVEQAEDALSRVRERDWTPAKRIRVMADALRDAGLLV